MTRILIVDDEPPIRRSLAGILSDEGYEISLTGSGEEALNSLDGEMPDVMLLDVWLPGMDGLEVLERARQKNSQLPVIMISGHANVENAVKAVRMGAYDFIEKPLDMDKTLLSLRNAVKMLRLTRENQMLRGGIPQLVGQSPAMIALREAISAVAPSNSWVLITGENGTGKELVANAIHRLSVRAEGPLVEVNCAAIPEDLIESELFGHEKGAFTGAGSRRQGRFDLANGGTLFLDEIADMSLKTQAKILRILQEQRFERVGGSQTIQVNVRVIAATNKDLNAEMAAGRFREDLYYRLNVVPIHIPPLRQRQEDIPLLTRDFLHQPHLSPAKRVSPEAMRVLSEYHWPGNVRELKNMIERLVIMTQGQEIGLSHLPEPLHQPEKDKESTELAVLLDKDYRSARAGFEKLYLQNKLRRHQGNMSQMAREVGLERSHLYKKFKILGLITDPEG